jgi:hypothetical protein
VRERMTLDDEAGDRGMTQRIARADELELDEAGNPVE